MQYCKLYYINPIYLKADYLFLEIYIGARYLNLLRGETSSLGCETSYTNGGETSSLGCETSNENGGETTCIGCETSCKNGGETTHIRVRKVLI